MSSFYVCGLVTFVNAAVSVAFSLSLVHHNGVVDVAALYGVARTVPLAFAVLLAALRRPVAGLVVLAPLLALVQLCDVLVGLTTHDMGKVVGPLALSAITAISAAAFIKSTRANPGPNAPFSRL
jgi:hypothetical protein